MHGVNLDLLRATSAHHPDGRPKDPQAQHRAEHLAVLGSARAARWEAALTRAIRLFRRPAQRRIAEAPCP